MTLFYRIVRGILIALGKPLLNIRIKGKENIPKDIPFVLCCNHTSATDVVPIIIAMDKQVFFMAKEEIFKHKIPAFIFRNLGVFPISRGAADRSALKKAISVLNEGNILGVFPEGTRNKEGAPKSAKAGTALILGKTNVGFLPVSIYRLGRFALFKKTVIRIGKYVSPNEIAPIESKADMQRVSEIITEKITKLWELGF